MAVLAAAALLDELMGRNRNIAPNEKAKELNWEDPEYCKYYLVKFCPHDLFVNTRADLGACPRVHDDEVKKLFESASSSRKLHYQEEFIRFCSSMVTEVERKIAKGKQRLALSGKSEVAALTPAQTQRNSEQITLLSERINGLVEEAERAGTEGNVEQAQGLMKLCDQLKEERETLRKQNENSHWSATAELAAAQEKQMEVCDVCGAFLIVGDAQQRIDDHLMGKQHVGYARLKIALDEISTAVHATREDRRSRYGAPGGLGSDERRHRERERERYVEQRDRERDRSERERPERNERPDSGDLEPKTPTLFILVYRRLKPRERFLLKRVREFRKYDEICNKKLMHGYSRNRSSSKDSSSSKDRSSTTSSSSSKDKSSTTSSSSSRDKSSTTSSSSSKDKSSTTSSSSSKDKSSTTSRSSSRDKSSTTSSSSSKDKSSTTSSSSSKDKSSTTSSSSSKDTYSSRRSNRSSHKSYGWYDSERKRCWHKYGWMDKDRERNDKDRRIKEKSRDRERRERRGGDRDGNKREKERDRDRRHRSERDSGAYNSHNKDSRGSSFRHAHRSR